MNVDRIVRHLDPMNTAPRLDEDARELCAEITAVPRNTGRPRVPAPRRWRVGVPLVAAVAAVVLALTWLLPGAFGLGPRPASAALDIKRQGGYYVVTVKDLFADPARYQAQLRGRGLNISLKLVPTTPDAEGRPFVLDPKENGLTEADVRLRKDLITTIAHPAKCEVPGGCAIGLKIPVGYTGSAVIYLGREARPGESYQDPPDLNAPGGPLHCVHYLKRTVDEVRTLLRRHGVPTVTFTDGHGTPGSVPGSWYVHDGVLSGPGRALLLVAPTLKRPDAPGPVLTGDLWWHGC
ncbi:hypothetical protein GCM10027176_49940 [Actinoallomurus bryophytorum]|uniref:Uncharacterized protein n=1 Tax=Actinoallomurus bryophytorum TaxID=1490222 RepID=A0A543CES4_9ACTN|nr:hypothetical protein [Actinoallomurus bryophytorum]TQL95594.1 hypothetical protein FB559_1102 [Actinoallomurus bryophytorum]